MKTLLFFVLAFSSSVSQAWFLFEPYIGYNRGQHQASRTQGLGYGARVGFDSSSLFLAADLTMADLQQSAISSVKYSDTAIVLGGVIKQWRLYYGMISSASFSYPSGTNTVAYKGTGTKVGLGAPIASKTYLNLELKTYDYTSVDNAGTTSAIAEVATLGFFSFSWVF
jgi:hypothetical protein